MIDELLQDIVEHAQHVPVAVGPAHFAADAVAHVDGQRDPQRPARMLPAYDSGDHLRQALEDFRAAGHRPGQAKVLNNLGGVLDLLEGALGRAAGRQGLRDGLARRGRSGPAPARRRGALRGAARCSRRRRGTASSHNASSHPRAPTNPKSP